jgi:hypothetical protein
MRGFGRFGSGVVCLVLACSSPDRTGPTPPGDAASVEISPGSVTLLELDSVAITVTVRDAAGQPISGRRIEWESSNPHVVSQPGADGWLRVREAGTTILTARVEPEEVSGTIEVTVTERPVEAVVVSPPLDSIVVGGSTRFNASALDEHHLGRFGLVGREGDEQRARADRRGGARHR